MYHVSNFQSPEVCKLLRQSWTDHSRCVWKKMAVMKCQSAFLTHWSLMTFACAIWWCFFCMLETWAEQQVLLLLGHALCACDALFLCVCLPGTLLLESCFLDVSGLHGERAAYDEFDALVWIDLAQALQMSQRASPRSVPRRQCHATPWCFAAMSLAGPGQATW